MADGSGTIDVGTNSAPVVIDWNEDGVLDLLVGNETSSQGIRLYINTGTATNPVLDTWTYLTSGGTNINWYRCCPQVHDMNGDGNKDLILGEGNAKIYYYENTGTNAAPAFSGYEAVQAGGSPIDLYYGTRLSVNDWNEDGLPDLLVSDYDGYVYVFMANSVGVSGETSGPVVSGLSISPAVNPSSGSFSFRLSELNGPAEITVYDASGRSVLSTRVTGELVTSSAGHLPAGVYSAVVRQGSSAASCRVVLTD